MQVCHLGQAPEELQWRLFEITQLTVRLHSDSDRVTLHIKLPSDYQRPPPKGQRPAGR